MDKRMKYKQIDRRHPYLVEMRRLQAKEGDDGHESPRHIFQPVEKNWPIFSITITPSKSEADYEGFNIHVSQKKGIKGWWFELNLMEPLPTDLMPAFMKLLQEAYDGQQTQPVSPCEHQTYFWSAPYYW